MCFIQSSIFVFEVTLPVFVTNTPFLCHLTLCYLLFQFILQYAVVVGRMSVPASKVEVHLLNFALNESSKVTVGAV